MSEDTAGEKSERQTNGEKRETQGYYLLFTPRNEV